MSFFEIVRESDRAVAKAFYKKYIDVDGMPVVASGEVANKALVRTHSIVTHLLAGRPDVIAAMVKQRMYLIIIGKDQVYTDMPEYRNSPNPAYMNERVRGTGGLPTSFGEENLLTLPIDRYDDESIGVHEFCHTIDSALASIDSGWAQKRNAAFRTATGKGLWKNSYAGSNPGEFWAEICQSYFDCNRVNNWNHGPIGTREQLKAYDPESYELVRTTFNLSTKNDWRYSPMQKVPNVIRPPARFKIDPFFTKFTWAREFPVVGRVASDKALLSANDTVRKMFAYRHDILKALINDGWKLVVVARGEKAPSGNGLSVHLTPSIDWAGKTLFVGENERNQPLVSQVVQVMATVFYRVCGDRPVDPNWDKRGREVQQYELRVKRLDVTWGDQVRGMAWRGLAGHTDPEGYWAAGVLAYFDALGDKADPIVHSRETLNGFDSGLYELVKETMAYEGHVDWRVGK